MTYKLSGTPARRTRRQLPPSSKPACEPVVVAVGIVTPCTDCQTVKVFAECKIRCAVCNRRMKHAITKTIPSRMDGMAEDWEIEPVCPYCLPAKDPLRLALCKPETQGRSWRRKSWRRKSRPRPGK